MSAFRKIIGENIRTYRYANHMTLEELTAKIHKSKATVGKYEQGVIAIDVDTLHELAEVFSIAPSQLMVEIAPPKEKPQEIRPGHQNYLYLFDGRTNRIVRGLLVSDQTEEDRIALFYSIPSFEEPKKCRALYYGHRQDHDFVTNYILENQHNGVEHLFVCVMRALDSPMYSTGLISGISSRMFLPACTKCVLSSKPLPETEELKKTLLLTKEDISLTKRYNMFMVEQSGPWN